MPRFYPRDVVLAVLLTPVLVVSGLVFGGVLAYVEWLLIRRLAGV